MNITKEVKELYNENFRTLRKEMKENPRRLKRPKLPRLWNERISIVIYSNIKKQYTNSRQSLVAKTVMNTKGSAGGIIVPGFKRYCRAMVIKSA